MTDSRVTREAVEGRKELKRLARVLAKAWAANQEDYSFLRDDTLCVLEQAYELGKKKSKP